MLIASYQSCIMQLKSLRWKKSILFFISIYVLDNSSELIRLNVSKGYLVIHLYLCHIPFSIPFPLAQHFASYKYVHGKQLACLIRCLCTSLSALVIRLDEIHLLIISLAEIRGLL